ncbi:hypothetical protein [Francisella philomiragia]|uniref:hypothetical protein n=1 Tax=Francisella philomiragia TaxID=28110 RepID=UPI001908B35D|nr:hypothetical protein [Francisella philomiragia]MBK2268294.1 hypothetical protein [Francisella philomiragia]MBK2279711.1 hypothetical protein [Francisella philomiragia]MBK2287605.1 hypothetical protein [Francisella philomiragia]MBK2289584.1 hypothetical protein [Francisella philomiragia]MBK2291482.1 hypothetical protein [Francisella philomiragia]
MSVLASAGFGIGAGLLGITNYCVPFAQAGMTNRSDSFKGSLSRYVFDKSVLASYITFPVTFGVDMGIETYRHNKKIDWAV